jgi:hypothetical protein
LEHSEFLFLTPTRPLLLANEIALRHREKDTLRGFEFQSHNFYQGAEQHLSSLTTHDSNVAS